MGHFFIIIFYIFISKNSIFTFNFDNETSLSKFYNELDIFVYKLFYNINEDINNTNSNCTNDILKYINKSDFYKNFLFDSSKNENDLMFFFNCMENNVLTKDENQKDPIYIITIIYNNTSTELMIYPKISLLGFCFPKIDSCDMETYEKIIKSLLESKPEFYNITLVNNSEIDLMKIEKNETPFSNENYFKILLYFIPLIIIIIQVIFCIFPNVAKKIVQYLSNLICCIKKQKDINFKNQYSQIKQFFNIIENLDELYGISKYNSKINNDSGIQYIIGIQSINLILSIMGIVFKILLNCPNQIYSDIYFKQLMNSVLYSIIFYSCRYAPRILFSCSGFILSYKFLCYIDDKTEEITDIKISEQNILLEEKKNDKKNFKNISLPKKAQIKEEIVLSFYYAFRFIIYQFHKYIIYILIILFTKYTLYYLQFSNVNPVWKYLYEFILEKSNFLHLITQFFFIRQFSFKFEYPKNNENSITNSIYLDFYWIISNEIIFFVFGVLFLYSFYRLKKFSIFYSIIIITIIIYFFKILINFKFYTTDYLSNFGYGKILINPIFNLPFYLIGIYFGTLNYIIEKRYTIEDLNKQKRNYLINPYFLINQYLKFKNNKKSYWLIYLFIPFICLLQKILLPSNNSNDKGNDFKYRKEILSFVYIFDMELLIFFLFYVSMIHFRKSSYVIYSILSFNYWIKFHKLYYSYILILPTITIYFLFQSESRFTLSFSFIFFYSIVIWIITQIIATLIFVFFEMPYKRLIKFLFKVKVKDLESEENYLIENEEDEIPL